MDVVGRPGSRPLGLIGMLALVLAVESFVTRHDLDALDPDDWQYHLARRTSAAKARGRDLLCFGDSLVKVGVLPNVVEARSGLKVYNMALCGSQAPASYTVLRRALAGGARPRAVLVDFHPALLSLPLRSNATHWPYLLGGWEALEMGCKARDPSLVGGTLVRCYLPSLRARNVLRGWAVTAVSGGVHRLRDDMPPVFRHWNRNAGAQVMPGQPGRAWDVAGHQRYHYPARWTPDRVNAEYLRRFLALAESHGLTVYWLIPPTLPAVQEVKERAGFDARYLGLVRSCQKRFPNLVVLDGRHAGYDPRVFFDPDHLGREGAFALSEDLGDTLRRLQSATPADRWVALPRYRARPTDPGIEAIFQVGKVADANPGPAVVR